MGSGFECYNNRKGISLGISWLHLNKPVYSFIENTNNLGISFIAHGTVSKVFNNKGTKSLSFKALLRRQSFSGNNSRQWMALTGITGGLPLIEYAGNILQFGIAARWGGVLDSNFSINALVPNFTYLNNAWSLSLSYDINTSGIKTQFAGGMELSTTYSFGKYDKCINCPSPYFSPAKNNIRNK